VNVPRLARRPGAAVLAVAAGLALASAGGAQNTQPEPRIFAPDPTLLLVNRGSELRGVVERFTADREVLLRRYRNQYSPAQRSALGKFLAEWRGKVHAIPFERLSHDAKVDYVLLRTRLEAQEYELAREGRVAAELLPWMPFADSIWALEDARREMRSVDPMPVARSLDRIAASANALRARLDALPRGDSAAAAAARPSRIVAFRAAEVVGTLRTLLQSWHRFYDGYDPLFSWWTATGFRAADTSLTAYARVLRERMVGWRRGDDEPIVGLPIGRDAVLASIRFEMLPYTPEELMAIAERELAWGESQMRAAAREMGFGDDWKAAIEKVKQSFVPPGRQTDLVRDLEFDGVAFLRKHDLITVPPLAQEVWRIEMIPPERQKVSPFFLGGEVLQVSYPTDSMTDDDKLMSMRGNNPHFSHATVFHEMIPGHHLQGFMTARYFPYRREFATPFWSEGGAFYWETIFWDLGYHAKPEDRIGALFWRMHRAARILFSLNFHLGNWTPERCIELLIDRVGHERANATAEVRRSFNGSYGPLYQVAYMMGGLQFRALHHEVVDAGRMRNREFHDFIYTHGSMPVEMVRASLLDLPLARDYQTQWKFAAPLPPPGAARPGTARPPDAGPGDRR